MADYGLLTTGFVPKTLEIIREEINALLRASFGESINLTDTGILGQLVGIMAERYAELWELAEEVAASQDPDAATKAALDALCALTGTTRDPARASTVTLTLTGTPATLVPAGNRAATASTAKEFALDADATIAAVTAWEPTTAYVLGARRTNASRVYQVITAGTSAGAGGPQTTDADITDNTVHWRYLGEGTGVTDVEATATVTGPVVAVSGDITTKVTPVGGWSSVINLLDADLGADVETDESLRVRREQELAQAGTGTADAIRAAVLDVAGVTSCDVFVNDGDATDADGVPPHAFEVLVRGGDDQDIVDAIFASKPAGIRAYGNTNGTAVDSAGTSHDVDFSRPVEVDIWVDVILVKDAAAYPTDGDAQVKAAIVAFGDAQKVGKNAVSSALSAQAFKVAGVLDVTTVEIGTANPPTSSATIAIGSRELAVYDTSRITVVTSNGTP